MALVRSCCGLWDLRAGARNIAIISMMYDLLMVAALLLILLIHVPMIPWETEQPDLNLNPTTHKFNQQVYFYLLVVSISVISFHLIPSFMLLYSTWEEISRGVSFWIFITVLSLLVHVSWIAIPFFLTWKLDRMVIHVTFTIIGILIMIYFLICVSSYNASIRERDQDHRAKRRLKEDY